MGVFERCSRFAADYFNWARCDIRGEAISDALGLKDVDFYDSPLDTEGDGTVGKVRGDGDNMCRKLWRNLDTALVVRFKAGRTSNAAEDTNTY